jgi:hypothetical protein
MVLPWRMSPDIATQLLGVVGTPDRVYLIGASLNKVYVRHLVGPIMIRMDLDKGCVMNE